MIKYCELALKTSGSGVLVFHGIGDNHLPTDPFKRGPIYHKFNLTNNVYNEKFRSLGNTQAWINWLGVLACTILLLSA